MTALSSSAGKSAGCRNGVVRLSAQDRSFPLPVYKDASDPNHSPHYARNDTIPTPPANVTDGSNTGQDHSR
jgi:hypothetical protein